MRMLRHIIDLFQSHDCRPLEDFGVKELTQVEELDLALDASEAGPVFVFKHSTACPTSHAAHKRVSDYLAQREGGPPFYLVKVIESRPLSNALAAALNVPHQSPQLLLVKDRKSVWNASHGSITGQAIQNALNA